MIVANYASKNLVSTTWRCSSPSPITAMCAAYFNNGTKYLPSMVVQESTIPDDCASLLAKYPYAQVRLGIDDGAGGVMTLSAMHHYRSDGTHGIYYLFPRPLNAAPALQSDTNPFTQKIVFMTMVYLGDSSQV